MSRSRKDRRAWKRKERVRNDGKQSPKVLLHRERFVQQLERASFERSGYRPVVFQVRLVFSFDEQLTELFLEGKKLVEIPFLVVDVKDCHREILVVKSDFNAMREEEILADHVRRVRHYKEPCHLSERSEEGPPTCTSCVACPHRRWIPEKGIAICRL